MAGMALRWKNNIAIANVERNRRYTFLEYHRLIAFPQVPSSEAFGRRLFTGSTARAGPASETLHESGHRATAGEFGIADFLG